jgi:hypothetical protein
MIATQSLGSISSLYASLPTTSASSVAGVGGLSSSQGVAGLMDPDGDGSSATISPLGQLLGNLQKLQAQNPTTFQQVVSQIANQLQTAAQQQGATPAGQFLTNLSDQFRNVANGASLSQVQAHHHGHHHHGYNSAGQPTSTSSATDPTNSTDLQQLFTTLNTEVTQALQA